jgi:hypothetical protein
MTFRVWLPCLHRYWHPGSPKGSRSASTLAIRPRATQRMAVQPLARAVHPHLHRHQPPNTPHGPTVASGGSTATLLRTWWFNRRSRWSDRASRWSNRGSSDPLIIDLLSTWWSDRQHPINSNFIPAFDNSTYTSGRVTAIAIPSTSVPTVEEGRAGVSFGQLSSDDHVGEAWLSDAG